MKQLAKYIFPDVCSLCQQSRPEEKNYLCKDCLEEIVHTQTDSCPMCSSDAIGLLDICHQCIDLKRPWDAGGAPLKFSGLTREIIHKFKYNSNLPLSKFLVHEMNLFIENRNFPNISAVTMVPLHWYKYFTRGFNQAQILAEGVADNLGIPCVKIIKRRSFTAAQALKSRSQRQKNITQIFTIPERQKVPNGAILLIDDVMTTGATLTACSKALTEAGAEKVYVLTAARG